MISTQLDLILEFLMFLSFKNRIKGKAIEHLITEGVKVEYFNDDRLGRVLDQLYRTRLNQIFMSVVERSSENFQKRNKHSLSRFKFLIIFIEAIELDALMKSEAS